MVDLDITDEKGLDGAGGGGLGGGKRDRDGNSAGSVAAPGFRGGCGLH